MPVKLNHNTIGEGNPLIMLHGLFGSSRNWQSVAKELGKQNRVITVDLRNHGLSEHTDSMTYAEMAEDVQGLIAAESSEPVSIIGHSMGGKVAMTHALLHPDSINKLLILDIAPVSYEHRYGKLFEAMQNLPLDSIKNRTEAGNLLNGQINDDFLTQFLLQNMVRNDNGFQWRLNLRAIQNNIESIGDFPALNAVFSKPVLFLGGADSHFMQPEHHGMIHRFFPTASIELLENAGHMLHIEQPQQVLDRIRLFLQT